MDNFGHSFFSPLSRECCGGFKPHCCWNMCLRTSDPSVRAVVQIRYRIFVLIENRVSSDHRCSSAVTTSVSFFSAQIEKCSRVSPGVRRTGSRAALLVAHQEKCCVFSHPVILHPLVLFSWLFSHRARLVNSAMNSSCLSRSEARESAHSGQCESVSGSSAHFELCESFVWFLQTLCELRSSSMSLRSPRSRM